MFLRLFHLWSHQQTCFHGLQRPQRLPAPVFLLWFLNHHFGFWKVSFDQIIFKLVHFLRDHLQKLLRVEHICILIKRLIVSGLVPSTLGQCVCGLHTSEWTSYNIWTCSWSKEGCGGASAPGFLVEIPKVLQVLEGQQHQWPLWRNCWHMGHKGTRMRSSRAVTEPLTSCRPPSPPWRLLHQ